MSDERETLDIDVLFVGAGPASLSGALHLARLVREHNEKGAAGHRPLEISIAVLEKGKEVGAHSLSGAVVDPRALRELLPETWKDAPFEAEVSRERFLYLSEKRALSLPIPPPLKNHGKHVASLGKLVKWLAPQVEAAGVDLFCEFPAQAALVEDGDDGRPRVVGVRTGDRGIDHHGEKKSNYEPGVDVRARVVVLGEGVRGHVTKGLVSRFGLDADRNPQVYAVGIKEIWELPKGRIRPGEVIHTLGWPLDTRTFGGSFIYGMQDDQVIVGLVVGLDYLDPRLDPHAEFQRLKTHPEIRRLLDGGKMLFYGAKALPEGGWWSMPRPWGPGFLLVGDSGGFLNSQRLKGVHLAIKSGMLAAETIFEALAAGGEGPLSDAVLARYEAKVEASWIREELWPVRNFHQAFDHGQWAGMLQAGVGMVTGGRGWGFKDRLETAAGHERMVPLDSAAGKALRKPAKVAYDGKLTFDKLADVYNSGTAHAEDQPAHLHVADPEICVTRCAREYANPCVQFCPAAVYEIVDDPSHASKKRLQINFSNCVHCKTCDIMDPYGIIDWVAPEGGGGPNYGRM